MERTLKEIKIGSHVGMAGKEMFLASVKEAASYGANVLMLYTGAPQNTRRKDVSELNGPMRKSMGSRRSLYMHRISLILPTR